LERSIAANPRGLRGFGGVAADSGFGACETSLLSLFVVGVVGSRTGFMVTLLLT
jgi:hypothetical protein